MPGPLRKQLLVPALLLAFACSVVAITQLDDATNEAAGAVTNSDHPLRDSVLAYHKKVMKLNGITDADEVNAQFAAIGTDLSCVNVMDEFHAVMKQHGSILDAVNKLRSRVFLQGEQRIANPEKEGTRKRLEELGAVIQKVSPLKKLCTMLEMQLQRARQNAQLTSNDEL